MNVLVIGNGFDQAHGLPTKYTEFLDFIAEYRKASESGFVWIDGGAVINSEKYKRVSVFLKRISPLNEESFRKIVNDNLWIEYFENRRAVIGDKWLDFETEIERVVRNLTRDKRDYPRIDNPIIEKRLRNKSYDQMFDSLVEELRNLKRALEIYLDGYVIAIPIDEKDKIPVISHLHIDKLLSYDYTNTYTEHYDPTVDCSYIHGKVNLNNKDDEVSIVLGFDDHYFGSYDLIPELIPFEKYYQRLIYRTDTSYYKWLHDYSVSRPMDRLQIYIYGHSLSPADGDVLKEIITAEGAHTTIFYKGEIDRANKLKNLSIILSPKELITRVSGTNPTIMFEDVPSTI